MGKFTWLRQLQAYNSMLMQVDSGEFTDSEIIVMLGENGTGKTTFIRMLAGLLKPDDDAEVRQIAIAHARRCLLPIVVAHCCNRKHHHGSAFWASICKLHGAVL